MSRFDEPDFNPLDRLKQADDLGVQPGYLNFASDWENRVDPDDLPPTEIDLRHVGDEAIKSAQRAIDNQNNRHGQ
ncbi:hypothetical protein GII36_02590 [Candidatus Mycosynbacter amalyticus]|uniref:Uncharacterized protein n=1 Tax=Candidatus Mycosynbacter amalyticus TaxID=2665156 RepID=A0A857MJI2_9BACT|nr:hypothetical protein [Candidatus Mycosynbacter amalyticus]QHN42734.1 hypothetical protein GII36_02590 [Candidatus Mycosynbacter amalyticus]